MGYKVLDESHNTNTPTSTPAKASGDSASRLLSDNYKLIGPLGETEISSIEIIRELDTGRHLLAKTIKGSSPAVQERFHEAIFEQAKLDHENIVQTIDWRLGENGEPVFITEFLEGVSLEQLIDEVGTLEDDEEITTFLIQVCTALEYAHSQGVVHGGLKPSNIIITKPDDNIVLKVLDFGAINKSRELPEHPEKVLSPYLSPEQRTSGATPRSDVFSVATLAYQLITGYLPFLKIEDGLVLDEANSELAPISDYRPDIPESEKLGQVLERALKWNPEERTASAVEFMKGVIDWYQSIGDYEDDESGEFAYESGEYEGVDEEESTEEPGAYEQDEEAYGEQDSESEAYEQEGAEQQDYEEGAYEEEALEQSEEESYEQQEEGFEEGAYEQAYEEQEEGSEEGTYEEQEEASEEGYEEENYQEQQEFAEEEALEQTEEEYQEQAEATEQVEESLDQYEIEDDEFHVEDEGPQQEEPEEERELAPAAPLAQEEDVSAIGIIRTEVKKIRTEDDDDEYGDIDELDDLDESGHSGHETPEQAEGFQQSTGDPFDSMEWVPSTPAPQIAIPPPMPNPVPAAGEQARLSQKPTATGYGAEIQDSEFEVDEVDDLPPEIADEFAPIQQPATTPEFAVRPGQDPSARSQQRADSIKPIPSEQEHSGRFTRVERLPALQAVPGMEASIAPPPTAPEPIKTQTELAHEKEKEQIKKFKKRKASKRRKSKVASTMTKLMALRNTQVDQDETVTVKFSETFAQSGPRLSPKMVLFRLVASVVALVVSGILVIANMDVIKSVWDVSSRNLGTLLAKKHGNEPDTIPGVTDVPPEQQVTDKTVAPTKLDPTVAAQQQAASTGQNPSGLNPISERYKTHYAPQHYTIDARTIAPKVMPPAGSRKYTGAVYPYLFTEEKAHRDPKAPRPSDSEIKEIPGLQ